MTASAWLWILGCCTAAAGSVWLITWLAKQIPPERVSDEWIASHIRERRDG